MSFGTEMARDADSLRYIHGIGLRVIVDCLLPEVSYYPENYLDSLPQAKCYAEKSKYCKGRKARTHLLKGSFK